MSKYLLGIDAGNTVVKAVLFDFAGRPVSKAALDGKSSQPQAGHVERDIAELWRNAAEVIQTCLSGAGAGGADVAAVGTAGHGNGLYLLDRANKPLVGIQSLDARASDLAATLRGDGTGDAVYPMCLQKPWPSQTATLLAWVKRNRLELYEQIGTVFLCKDTLTLMLTGERVTDCSDMSGCGLMRLPGGTYDQNLLEAYGLGDALDLLPPPLRSDAIAGHITAEAARKTGLVEGTPVAAGFFDIIASSIGAGAVSPGQASIVVGTWGINQVIMEKPLIDASIFHACTWRDDRYVAVESSATSAVNLEWYVREIMGGHGAEAFASCNALAASVETGIDSPLFHPFLYGSATEPNARGAFLGVTGWHSQADLVRALYEGVVFEHRRHIERLRKAGARFDSAILSGGGSRSAVWRQMFADVLGVPVSVSDCDETGALGAAIAAGVAAAQFASLEDGAACMVREKVRVEPSTAQRSLIDARYRLYCGLADAMPDHWQRYRSEPM